MMRPPMVPPIWFWFKNGIFTPEVLLKKSLAAKWLLRFCMYTEPWYWLVPPGVMKDTWPAPP